LGALGEYQIIDGLGVEEGKRFMFHYNFPPFSVGETGRYSYPSRREIGHGALSEKALLQVLPSEDEFPYTIRIVSEILESNGSSSQASICAGTLALMAAGVPIKAPIAGIAMGLITDGKNYTILTDIQGMEDHYGDMDFKVAGSATGITALQMDIKIAGIDEDILREALAQARSARLKVLEHMLETIPAPRSDVSQYAPKVISFFIDPRKIRDVIGSGGRIITDIINQCNDVKIDIENDGRVTIMHPDKMWAEKAARIIEDIVREVEVGEFYSGKVVRIEKFGAFVELWQNTEGLIHISKMAAEKVARVEDVLHLGDEIIVKVIGIDDKGRIDLATKDYVENRKKMPPRKKPPYGVKRKAPRQ
ncbi:MAG: polyribonucleotide nucleotidyltransferase, partial [Bacilli bacterium]